MLRPLYIKFSPHLKSFLYSPEKQLGDYRPDVDGLRAIAVLAVVMFHAFPAHLSGGFVGVDVFFVLSGFLITGIIYKGLRADKFGLLDFWARRIRRIFPSLLVVIIASFVGGWWYLLPAEFETLKSHIKWGLAFIANFKLNSEIGYFDTAADLKPLLHLWSLAIEEQFYLVWPALLWFSFRKKLNFFAVTLVLAIVSYKSRKFFDYSASDIFYFPWTRFWELQIGALLAIWNEDYAKKFGDFFPKVEGYVRPLLIYDKIKFVWPLVKNALSAIGFALIVYACIGFTKSTPFPSKLTLYPVVGAALLIAAGKDTWFNQKFLSLRILRFIGVISFPLYLWHWPILSYLRIVTGEPSSKILILAVAASFILAIATFYSVEKFLRFERGPLHWRAPSLAVALCGILIFAEYASIEPRSAQFGLEKINAAIQSWEYPTKNMAPKYFTNGLGYYEANPGKQRSVVFIGNSHMCQYAPAIEALLNKNGERAATIIFVNTSGCEAPPGSPTFAEAYSKFKDVLNKKEIANLERVVWAQSWNSWQNVGKHCIYGGVISLTTFVGGSAQDADEIGLASSFFLDRA